ncbi:GNAT family N-acetyltransferase [Lentisalinibacter sediminis]
MNSCKSELTLEPARIDADQYHCFVAVDEGETAGFYALERLAGGEYELEALFVEPGRIGSGIGRALIDHAKRTASRFGATRLVIQGDPHADDFYLAAGARQIGHRESDSIPGRYLPLFEIVLE